VGTCFDGTPYESCSVNVPQYCEYGGTLIANCAVCGCNEGETCLEDNSCALSCEDDVDCPIDYECKSGACWLEEAECQTDFDCPEGKFCSQGDCKMLVIPAPKVGEALKELKDMLSWPISIIIRVLVGWWLFWLVFLKNKRSKLELALAERMERKWFEDKIIKLFKRLF